MRVNRPNPVCNSGFAGDLNAELARAMHGRSGAAVVVDVTSGHVLALYHPSVAARRLVRPGSAFKPFTLLALLQSGKLIPTESFVCRRTCELGPMTCRAPIPRPGRCKHNPHSPHVVIVRELLMADRADASLLADFSVQ